MRFLAVMCVKNEASFLLEWLAFHKAVGFTDFVIAANDCEDGTFEMLDRLQELGHLEWVRNVPEPGENIQFQGLKLVDEHPLKASADWIMQLDIDEFVNIHEGDRTLPALVAALPKATAITLTWRTFGADGRVHFEDLPITEQFMMAAPRVHNGPWQHVMFKTLFKNDGIYKRLGVHRPRNPAKRKLDQVHWFDGSGRRLPPALKTERIFSNYRRDNYGLVQLNHYPLCSIESFIVKSNRGRAVNMHHNMAVDYWVERNINVERDDTIQALAPRWKPILDDLMADPRTAELHEAGVAWRKARFEALMEKGPNRALYARLNMAPPSIPLGLEASETIAKFAQRENLRRQGRL